MKKSIILVLALASTLATAARAQDIGGSIGSDFGNLFPPSAISEGIDGEAVKAFYGCLFGKKQRCDQMRVIEAEYAAKQAAAKAAKRKK